MVTDRLIQQPLIQATTTRPSFGELDVGIGYLITLPGMSVALSLCDRIFDQFPQPGDCWVGMITWMPSQPKVESWSRIMR